MSTIEDPGGTDLSPEPAPQGSPGEERVELVLARELGARTAAALERWRRQGEARLLEEGEGESLRDRKKRLTRQRISDVATTLFLTRGFDRVKVSEVARLVGVSEKTVFNYFPTKESMVFDRADEQIERLARALRERGPEESLTRVMLTGLREQLGHFAEAPEEAYDFVLRFAAMVAETPALRTAWRDLQERVVEVARQVLAEAAEIDPRDPEPLAAARALAGLREVLHESMLRHVSEGLRGESLNEAVLEDLERAARLLETGLWSFNLLTQGFRSARQLREAAQAAEAARTQVFAAVKQARAAFRDLRGGQHEELRQTVRDIAEARREATRAGQEAARAGRDAIRGMREQLGAERPRGRSRTRDGGAAGPREKR